jgi:putative DNA primase/helicase
MEDYMGSDELMKQILSGQPKSGIATQDKGKNGKADEEIIAEAELVNDNGQSFRCGDDNISFSCEEHPLQQLVRHTVITDLVKTLTDKIGDSLCRYRDEKGMVDEVKIPQSLYIVAIIHEIIYTAKKINLGISVKHSVIFVYTGKYWQEIKDEEIKKILSTITQKLGFYSPALAKTSEFKDKLFKQFLASGLEESRDIDYGGKVLINLDNGTLVIHKGKVSLKKHSYEDFITYVLPYLYDKEAESPTFDKFINRVIPDVSLQKVLQEFIGWIFTTDMKLEKAAVLYGSGANGKSVFFEVMSELIGIHNMSTKSMGDVFKKGERGNNHRAEVENKLVNYSSEISPAGADIDIFKAFTSHEPVDARRLYKDVYTFRPTTKFIFNANELPRVTEATNAYFRRFTIINFSVTIPESDRNPNLHKEIIGAELSGVLNWAIAGLLRLLEQGDFSKCDAVDSAGREYRRSSDNVALWVEDENIEPSPEYDNPEHKLFTAQLYKEYREWCDDNGHKPFTKNNFGKHMTKLGFEQFKSSNSGYFVKRVV